MGTKSKPTHAAKKPGKSIKQRRAEKHAKAEYQATHLDIHEMAKRH
ncbi:hypothetical protein SAMN05216199_2090 [Pedococcus cremeus]|jgi:hypothetical protein|uniref:Uncharacterized protein n=1 Tax=Pedococcus cremeus TaxID=587636 RepID=A0A1H9UT02_9MICO|nr:MULTISPECIES: hypothetical protein [Intrasporangiaceae]TQJ51407.1 hypothetical protein FBY26_3136 [Phycicoccus sp. SLBN-51]SES12469.1 hypothetical protein SAMN05216199_2090 [Pedococcus cremeus]